ncbi:RNA polymerase sigma-70 factor [Rapidithrix thailandica]|uniref:RNA polymerase sigma-70 factor n=1 Tax=Rapidithrix thailandica TaxID=413964 RepID=A0AAW9RZC4_9BACT
MKFNKVNTSKKDLHLKQLEALHDQYFDRLYHYTLYFVKHAETAEEIVYDVFMKIWKQIGELDAIRNPEAYLYTLTRNHALNHLKSHQKYKGHLTIDGVGAEPSCTDYFTPEAFYLNKELEGVLNAAIEQLPPQCKKVFRLVKQEGYKYRQAAEQLNISVNTVDIQMARAVKKLRNILQEYAQPDPTGKDRYNPLKKMVSILLLFI